MAVDKDASKLKFVDFGLADIKENNYRVGTVDYWTPQLMLDQRNNLPVDDYWATMVSAFEIHLGRYFLQISKFYKCSAIDQKFGKYPTEDKITEEFEDRVKKCFEFFEDAIIEAFGNRLIDSKNRMEKFQKECGEEAKEAYNRFYFNALMLITVTEADFQKMMLDELKDKFKIKMEESDHTKINNFIAKFNNPLSSFDLRNTDALFTKFVSPLQESINLCTEFQKPKPLKTKMAI